MDEEEIAMVGNVRLDAKLVANAFDANQNGRVDDDLTVQAGAFGGAKGPISVERLADAIAKDEIVISQGAVLARKPAGPAEVKVSQDTAAAFGQANFLASEAVMDFALPSAKFDRTFTDATGKEVTKTDWVRASFALKARLLGVMGALVGQSDPLARMITSDIQATSKGLNPDYRYPDAANKALFDALYARLEAVKQETNLPSQPAQSVDRLATTVNAAGASLVALRGAVKAAGSGSTAAEALAKAAALRGQARAIPLWKRVLLFGLFKKWSLEGQADRLELGVKAAKTDDFSAADTKLRHLVVKAYEARQQAASAKNLLDAADLERTADDVAQEAANLSRQADRQTEQVKAILQ